MKNSALKIAAILGVAVMLTACSGGSKGKFVKNCQDSLASQTRDADGAKVVCECSYKRLSDELSGKQLAMAAELMGLEDNRAVSEYVRDNKGGELVSERMQGAVKSCMGGGL